MVPSVQTLGYFQVVVKEGAAGLSSFGKVISDAAEGVAGIPAKGFPASEMTFSGKEAVSSLLDGVSSEADGVSSEADGVSSETDGVSSVTDGVSSETDGVSSVTDGVSSEAEASPSRRKEMMAFCETNPLRRWGPVFPAPCGQFE